MLGSSGDGQAVTAFQDCFAENDDEKSLEGIVRSSVRLVPNTNSPVEASIKAIPSA